MTTKEQWIDETMESLGGLQRPAGDPGLYEKIVAQPGASEQKIRFIPVSLLLKIAAGLALLIGLNVITLLYYNSSTVTAASANPLTSEYFSYIKTITP
jgi:hypothetical protein